jgi:hypothetical protein
MKLRQADLLGLLRTAAGYFALTLEGSNDHGGGAAYAAFYGNCASDTIFLAGAAFHAVLRLNQARFAILHGKDSMWANSHAHGTPVAQFGLVRECIGCISIEHMSLRSADEGKDDQQQDANAKHPCHDGNVGEYLPADAAARGEGGRAGEV